jgi:TPR repeat protein
VTQNHVEAAKWYRKAAEQNYAPAQFNLGRCYAKGEGVKQDYVEACAWYDLAAKTLESAAKSRDALEKQQMSPEQVVAVQKRAKELRAKIDASLKSSGK